MISNIHIFIVFGVVATIFTSGAAQAADAVPYGEPRVACSAPEGSAELSTAPSSGELIISQLLDDTHSFEMSAADTKEIASYPVGCSAPATQELTIASACTQ